MYKKTVLDNGVRVVTANMPQMKSVSFGIWFGAGGRFENKDNSGISHFLEHMCFKGSKRFSGREIKETIEGVGGSLNGFTSEELTCYLAKILNKHLEKSFEIMTDMALNPLVDKTELEKERYVILEEIRMYRDQPQSYVHELLDALLWPQHPLGMNLAGTFETVKKLTRNDLISFKDKFYSAENLVVTAAGDITHDRLAATVRKSLAKLPKSKKNEFIPFKSEPKKAHNLFYKKTEQTHLTLGFGSLRRGHPDRHVVMLMHIILGANMSSRLFDELREKRGLAYEIGTQVKSLQETGAFIVHAGVDNKRTLEAIEVILSELSRIKKEKVSLSEFRRAKDFYLGQLTFGLEQTMEEMLYMGEQTISLDKVKTQEEIIRELNRVKIEDLMRVSGDIFTDKKINLALIGPVSDRDKRKIIKALSL